MESAGSGLHKLMVELLRSAPAEDLPLLGWAVVCGTAVASRTRAIALQDGVLRVEVPDAPWRNQLLGFSKRYLDGLNLLMKRTGGPNIKGLCFTLPGEGGDL